MLDPCETHDVVRALGKFWEQACQVFERRSKIAVDVKVFFVSQLDFRCSRWPPRNQIADELDVMQCKMTADLLKEPWQPHEELCQYFGRRGRLASIAAIQGSGLKGVFGEQLRVTTIQQDSATIIVGRRGFVGAMQGLAS